MLERVHAMKALDLTLILSYWDLLYLFPFGSYGRLNKKCRYKNKILLKMLGSVECPFEALLH